MPLATPRPKRRQTLDRNKYVPAYLIGLANRYSRGASKLYLKLFGVGIIEWRMLSVLSIEGKLSANAICERIDLDKAAASRSVKVLLDNGLVTTEVDPQDSRKHLLDLTPAGEALHDRILAVALKRQDRLLRELSREEVKTLLSLLKRLSDGLEKVEKFDEELASSAK